MRQGYIVVLLIFVVLVGAIIIACGNATEDTAEWHFNQGNKLAEQGRYEQAIEDYDQAIRLNPEDADAYYNRGIVYYELGQLERAIEDYDEAIRLNPEYTKAYYNRGIVYRLIVRQMIRIC